MCPLYHSLNSLSTTQMKTYWQRSYRATKFSTFGVLVQLIVKVMKGLNREFSRNYQRTCNSLRFLAYHNKEWQFNTAQLDKVLKQGDVLYGWVKANLLQEDHYMHNLTIEELPDQAPTDTNVYSVNVEDVRYGYLKAAEKKSSKTKEVVASSVCQQMWTMLWSHLSALQFSMTDQGGMDSLTYTKEVKQVHFHSWMTWSTPCDL